MAHATSHSINEAHPDGSDDQRNSGAPNESTPLLSDVDAEALSRRQATTPLPKAQIGALVVIRLADPVAYLQIFPYINQLLVEMRVAKPERVGLYSGLVESAFSLAQVFSVYQWGRISDAVGRRPVMFVSLICTALGSIAFGLSTSFAGIVATRFIGGLVAGNSAVINSVLTEITDDTNQDFAIPIYSVAWPLGTILGPFIGGSLENAATRYPSYFSWHFFVEYPYLPPCIASAACALVALVLGCALVEETLPSKRKHDRSSGKRVAPPLGPHADTDWNEARPASATELLSIPAIRVLTISGFAVSFLSLAFDVVFTLFCYTPVDSGGLGLDPSAIGNTLALAGLITILLRFFIMPHILRRFDYAKTYNACMHIWPIAFGLLPFLNLFARAYPSSSSTTTSPASRFLWTALFVPLVLSKIGMFPHALSMILVKRHVPSSALLGRSNGLVQFAMCVGRAAGPLLVSILFTSVNGMAWAKRWGLGGLWAVGMVIVAVAGARVTRGLESHPRGSG